MKIHRCFLGLFKKRRNNISKLLKNETAFDPAEFRETYADIENEHVGFLKRYRAIKKEIYDLSRQLKTDANE